MKSASERSNAQAAQVHFGPEVSTRLPVGGDSPVPVDVPAIMREIRAKVAREIEAGGRARPVFRPLEVDPAGHGSRKAGELLHSEDLRYLNTHYSFSSALSIDELKSHRPGIIGRTIVAAKRKLMRIIFDSLLKDYFSAEREFNAHVVRMLNDISKYVDARDASNFWELIRKIDIDTTKAIERIERLSDEYGASLRSSEKRLAADLSAGLREINALVTRLQGESERHGASLKTLDSVARGLEGAVARISARGEPQSSRATDALACASADKVADQSYVLLENRYRGSEADISERLKIYSELFTQHTPKDSVAAALPVLEIGSGRGELQAHFKSAGISSIAVDTDAAMVQVAAERGILSQCGDGLRYLAEREEKSLRGVIAVQVVEHLTREQLATLMRESARAVCPGGLVVFETINPQSLTALSSNYFRDPTHVWPLHPDTLSYMMTLAGIEIVEVRMLSPVPEGALLKPLKPEPFMTPHWSHMVELFNDNIARLNQLLFGYQDYCVIGRVRG